MIIAQLYNETLIRILQILLVPYYKRSVIWTIAPLIVALVMIQMYFGKYKTEPLGWNTAFSNSVSLMWVTAILLKYMSDTYGLSDIFEYYQDQIGYIIMVSVLAIFTLTLIILNYNHLIPKRFAFILSSSIPVNVSAYLVIVIVMGRIPIDWITFLAVIVLFFFLSLVFAAYRRLITPAKSAMQTLKEREEKEKKIKYYKKRKFREKIEEEKKAIKRKIKNIVK